MNINVTNLENVLQKATMNYLIPSVQLVFDGDKVSSKMVSGDQRAIVILDLPNSIAPGFRGEFNFSDVAQNVKRYLDLIEEDEAAFRADEKGILLTSGTQKININYCLPDFVTTFGGDGPQGLEYFTDLRLNEDVTRLFNKASKIASVFDKIYFTVSKNTFFMEATDKNNRFSNGVKFEMGPVKSPDLTLLFDYKKFKSILSVLNGASAEFTANFAFVEEQDAGMVTFLKDDGSEQYFLMSNLE